MGEHGPLRPGEVFAGYTIERVLGVGGMGTVYAAAHPRLPRRIALKVLHPALAEDDDARARFEREADHAARLEHPNIVVYDLGREGDQNHSTGVGELAQHRHHLSVQRGVESGGRLIENQQ
nr:hypothetical protein GCM10017611_05240 [Rhodococcus wratislaviensis]